MAEFRTVARLEELPEIGGKEVVVDGKRICLFKHQGQVFATSPDCPHKGTALAIGWVENGTVACALHGWKFDLRTGECDTNCHATIRTFPVKIEDGLVQIGGEFDLSTP